MAQIAELMRANLVEVFGERDGERRRAAIARIHRPDVVFHDPEAPAVGHEALHAGVQAILDGAPPEFGFSPAGPVRVNDDLGYLPWNLGAEGAPQAVRGVDIRLVRDGLTAHLYTLLLTD
jgi:hypothetical protein